jgi:hypothetical protein
VAGVIAGSGGGVRRRSPRGSGDAETDEGVTGGMGLAGVTK